MQLLRGSPADEGYSGVVDTPPRTELSDGIAEISKDSSVSDRTLTGIALVRTVILSLVLGLGLVSLYLLWGTDLKETASHSDITLVLDLCVPKGPTLSGTGVLENGFVSIVGDKERKIISFAPVGPKAAVLGLEMLTYFESEEQLAGGMARSTGFSFGLFRANEIEFSVSVHPGNDHACIEKAAKARGIEVTEALQFFGAAVAGVLTEAGRRDPHDAVMTTPSMHGSLLMARGSNTVWSTSAGMFMGEYSPSDGWKAYRAITIILRICLTTGLVLLFGKFVFNEWRKALGIWVVQYDYLWQDEAIRIEALRHHQRELKRKKRREAEQKAEPSSEQKLSECLSEDADDGAVSEKQRGSREIFNEAVQACSTFFVLDHLIGDPQSNADRLSLGAASALVHGLASILLCALPVVHGLSFHWYEGPCWALITAYILTTIIFGAQYYFAVPYVWRKHFLRLQLILSGACFVYSCVYVVSVILFLLTRLIVDTEHAIGYCAAVGSVIVYVMLVSKWLLRMREGIIQKLEGKKESRGVIIRFLKFLGLDNKTIILSVASGTLLLILLAAMLLLADKLYFTDMSWGDVLAATFTPFATFGAMLAQMQQKQGSINDLMGNIGGTLSSVV